MRCGDARRGGVRRWCWFVVLCVVVCGVALRVCGACVCVCVCLCLCLCVFVCVCLFARP